ncbi:SDR family NAD(P)-dependent oxidoreductase [Urechidicola vernalis]|uniref:SDR family oxidoreductase n=1 Tax=Urechidicola vernalis TaxID=3075600 RepID=A0ABU2Y3D0_9FLAO|nr:SDR family oxidoreductase [Urechidicola sp. P050]MDT0552537.1 SDR family oxidoreductase [Urechidicola sp. P050]
MKNVIVTGASRGIGFELIQLFAKNDYNVLAISRNIDPIEKLQVKNITSISADLSEALDLERISTYIKDNLNQIDILIHNAGALINKPFTELSSEDFINVYKVNVFAVAELTKLSIPYLKKGSHVVTISSMGGIQGSLKFPGLAAYSSSKGAVITLMELLAEEYKDTGIVFNTLALGAVQTEMLQEAFPGYEAPVTPAQMADYIYNFALNGNTVYNGKVLQVSLSTP